MTPVPPVLHQRVLRRICHPIATYLVEHPVGEPFFSPSDLSWGDDILVQPDFFVVRRDEASTLDWAQMKQLLLAIEVLSPSSNRADRFSKRRLYQEVGIPPYWMVDADERVVEVWTPDATFPVFEREQLTWQPDGAHTPLTIPCAELFRPE